MTVAEKESVFQARIVAMAERFGWSCWHVPAPMRWDPSNKAWVPARQAAGLPDLILIHDDPPRLVFMEVKREGGKLTDKQREFLQAAREVAWIARDVDSDIDPVLEESGCWACPPAIGVMAVWPKDEAAVEQMLRSKVVA